MQDDEPTPGDQPVPEVDEAVELERLRLENERLRAEVEGTTPNTCILTHSRTTQGSWTSIRNHGRDGHQWWVLTATDPDAPAPADLKAAATELARSLADGPTVTYGHMKQNLNMGEHARLAECLDSEAWRHIVCMSTADHREAAAAFVEKRPPRFTGK